MPNYFIRFRHKIAKEVLNVDDKIEYIYLYLLKQNQKSKIRITEQKHHK